MTTNTCGDVTRSDVSATADAELMARRHRLDSYLNVDCGDKPLNLETNKNMSSSNMRSPQTPLSDQHSTPIYTAGTPC